MSDTGLPIPSNLLVTGGEFSLVNGNVTHNVGGSAKDTEHAGIQLLHERILPGAFHNSRDRSKEVESEILTPLVHKWALRLFERSSTSSIFSPSSNLTNSLSEQVEPNNPDEIIKDIFTWLYDRSTPFLIMWIHDEGRAYSVLDLVSQAIARILYKQSKLAASFFSPSSSGSTDIIVDNIRVIPSLAYQLAQNVPATRSAIAHAVLRDTSIFNLEIQTQVERLLFDPVSAESGMMEQEGIPKVFLIHGLERFDNEDHFQSSFLNEFADMLSNMEAIGIPHRLLVFGKRTDFLQRYVSNIAMRQMVLQRPLMARLWLGKEKEFERKAEELRRWEKVLKNREEELKNWEEELKKKEGESTYAIEGKLTSKEEESTKGERPSKNEGSELKNQEELSIIKQALLGTMKAREEKIKKTRFNEDLKVRNKGIETIRIRSPTEDWWAEAPQSDYEGPKDDHQQSPVIAIQSKIFHQVSYQNKYTLPEPSKVGGIIIFRSSVIELDDRASDGTSLNLLNKGGDIMLHLNFRPYRNVVVFNTHPARGGRGREEAVNIRGWFEGGRNVTVAVYEHPNRYQILFNGKTAHYYDKRIHGDACSIMYGGSHSERPCFSNPIAFDIYTNWAALVPRSN